MTTDELARKLMAEERLEEEAQQEKLLERATEGVNLPQDPESAEKARELLAQERLAEEELQEKMLERAEEEIQSV